MTDGRGRANGTVPDADEAAAGQAAAGAPVDESLEERLAAVRDDLGDVERSPSRDGEQWAARGQVFAVVAPGRLEAALDPAVLRAALRTPDVRPGPRGAGWLAFEPRTVDRYALDRAEAWLRLAHRRATAG